MCSYRIPSKIPCEMLNTVYFYKTGTQNMHVFMGLFIIFSEGNHMINSIPFNIEIPYDKLYTIQYRVIM